MKYEVTVSPIGSYSFVPETFNTTASSPSKACFNVYHREQNVKYLVNRDLAKLEARPVSKTSQEVIMDFLEMNYNDIISYERKNMII